MMLMEKTLPKEGQSVIGQGIFRYKTSISRKNLKRGEHLAESISSIQEESGMEKEDFYEPAVVLLAKIHESIKHYQ